jgi:peptidoglycan/LPS O-acetylase OafA/YrhL
MAGISRNHWPTSAEYAFPPYTGFLHALLPLLFFVSGVVSYGSYSRSTGAGDFLPRRLISLLAPYYLLTLLIFCSSAFGVATQPTWDATTIVDWLLLNPSNETMPFPLGQVWFLHAITLITLVSPLVYARMQKHPHFALLPIAVAVAMSVWVLFVRIDRSIVVFGHNTFQAIANSGFYFLGAYVVATPSLWTRTRLLALIVGAITVAAALPPLLNLPVDYRHHSYAPDLYYLSGSFAVIFAALALKHPFRWLCIQVRPLGWMLEFVSRHSYPIFLLHSFFIFATERWLGLVQVSNDPVRALAKVLLVVTLTFMAAIPFSAASKRLAQVLRNLLKRPAAAQVA